MVPIHYDEASCLAMTISCEMENICMNVVAMQQHTNDIHKRSL
jgi:hypothetical protein